MRDFIDHLSNDVRMTTVAHVIGNIGYAARLIAPQDDWRWLCAIRARIAALARPEDRFDRLIPPWQILDLGIELMEQALEAPSDRYKRREILYRDGLLLALLSLWPIRRRSIAALSASRHVRFDGDGVNILLYPEDTKAKRAESFRAPEQLVANLIHYLKVIRPSLLGANSHDGLWASYRERPLIAARLYCIVRSRLGVKFGKSMSLHDIRRSAATFLATYAPDQIGLIPGVLQHVSPDTMEYYNLARSTEASRRLTAHQTGMRERMRRISPKNGIDRCAP
jgi:integrase